MSQREPPFAEWIERYQGIVVKTARAFAPPSDQDDLVQEILINLWRARPHYRGEASESTFLYRVAHNTALTWRRGWMGLRRREAAEPVRDPAVPMRPGDDRIEQLYAAIRTLPEIDRSLLLLHLDDLSYREIAAVAGISESNVGARLTRIRHKLIALVKGESS